MVIPMVEVWLAEKSGGLPSEVLGIFSAPGRATDVCQDVANEYFGAARTPPLKWAGDDGYRNASYYCPGDGINYLFQVTRFAVDQVSTP